MHTNQRAFFASFNPHDKSAYWLGAAASVHPNFVDFGSVSVPYNQLEIYEFIQQRKFKKPLKWSVTIRHHKAAEKL